MSPTKNPTDRTPEPDNSPKTISLGFNPEAERLNGRLAMIGFSVLLASALVAHQGF
jgi:hypothetical protein